MEVELKGREPPASAVGPDPDGRTEPVEGPGAREDAAPGKVGIAASADCITDPEGAIPVTEELTASAENIPEPVEPVAVRGTETRGGVQPGPRPRGGAEPEESATEPAMVEEASPKPGTRGAERARAELPLPFPFPFRLEGGADRALSESLYRA